MKTELTQEEAIALSTSRWWETKTAHEIAEFQLFTKRLCCPFDVFHKALEEVLGRNVFTHELGLNYDYVCKEFLGEREKPTFEEIINLIPEDKRLLISFTKEDIRCEKVGGNDTNIIKD